MAILERYLADHDMTIEELNEIVENYLKTRKPTYPTLLKYLLKKSCGAWIRFHFKVDREEYYCVSAEDFIITYGTISKPILEEYVVIGEKCYGYSQDQGSVYDLTIKKIE